MIKNGHHMDLYGGHLCKNLNNLSDSFGYFGSSALTSFDTQHQHFDQKLKFC